MNPHRCAKPPGRAFACTALLAVSAFCGVAWSAPPPNITPTETALLPAYCQDTQTWPGGRPGGIERGKAIYGEVFWHFHHYCYAMVWMMRADRATSSAMERRGNLAGALDDLDYVLKYLSPGYFLLPEILTRKGRVLRMQEKFREAVDVLREATAQSPTYWRAYLELANCFEAMNERAQAIAALREGLAHTPDSRGLSLYLKDLERSEKRTASSQSDASAFTSGAAAGGRKSVSR